MNLWADDDTNNNSPLATEANEGRKSRGRLTEQAVLSAIRTWLLTDYVPSYSHALAAMRVYRRCYWIDAWGGHLPSTRQSRVSITSTDVPVSSVKSRKKETTPLMPPVLQPIVALLAQLAQESRPIALHGLILEAGSRTRKESKAQQHSNGEEGEKASAATEQAVFTLPKESGIVRASWSDVGSAMLQEIDQSPAIFLLNPFGPTLFRYDDLAPLYQRAAPTELCLLISHKQAETQLLTASRFPATATALTALLRTDRWKTLVPQDVEALNGSGSATKVNGLIDLLVTSMRRHFLAVELILLPLQRGPASVELAPTTLLFATRSKDSQLCMNDAVCLQHRRVMVQSYRGVLGEDWFVAQQQERYAQSLQNLRQRIQRLGQAQRSRRWPDVRQHLLSENFGQYTVQEYNEALADLIRDGMVRCEWRSRLASTGSQDKRVPGNEDTLLWK